ncbi:MAG: hypothetical protein AAGA03_05650 [Planctomycetota bacterium]
MAKHVSAPLAAPDTSPNPTAHALASGPIGRRDFLVAAAATTAVTMSMGTPVSNVASGADATANTRLVPDLTKDLFRVRIEMDVQGNVDLPDNPLASRVSKQKLPIKSKAIFDYEERYRHPEGYDRDAFVVAAERYYHEAKNSSQLNRDEQELKLRESVRHVVVRRETLPEIVYSPDDSFTHDELGLIRIPASSAALDQLLPSDTVSEGYSYDLPAETLGSLLNLTTVDRTNIKASVVEVSPMQCRIQLEGDLDGSVDGVPTVIRVAGKLVFDRRVNLCTWLALGVHETREIGKAEPGFDVQATIKMVRQPLAKLVRLTAKPLPLSITQPIPAERLLVGIESESLAASALMDRRWRMMRDVPGSAMMRMIQDDQSIAQCDLRPLAPLSPGQQWTLAAFEADLRRTLSGQMTDLIQAGQGVSDSGLRVLQATAAGQVEGVPIQWIVMHFSDDNGRRLLATFTMAASEIDRFAGSDLQLTASMRFQSRGNLPSEAEELASDEKNGPQIARRADSADDEVQSVSDVR